MHPPARAARPQVAWGHHLNKLKYHDWAIKQTLRIVHPVPGIVKRSEVDAALAPAPGQLAYHVPSRTSLFLSFLPVHMDPAV